jgi:hypothetical protein
MFKSVFLKIVMNKSLSINGTLINMNQSSIILAEVIFKTIAGGTLGGVVYATIT